MQETPPNSPSEIPAYFLRPYHSDGVPDFERLEDVNALESQFPESREEMRIRTKKLLSDAWDRMIALPLPDMPDGADGFWPAIARTLESDRQVSPITCDAEWLSAWYDREIPADDPLLPVFESQLYHNPQANQLLAELSETSEAIRRFVCRMEESCAVSLTSRVMAVLASGDDEASLPPELPLELQLTDETLASEGLAEAEVELLSAYVDEALSTREIIDVNRLTENSEPARDMLFRFNRLSAGIQSLLEEEKAQAPDLRSVVLPILTQEMAAMAPPKRVVPFANRKALRFVIPAAAAVALIWFFLPHEQRDWIQSDGSGELASVPGHITRVEFDRSPVVEATTMTAYRNEPVRENRAAIRDVSRKTPTSEEYLFAALKANETAKEDVAVIFGQ